MSTALNMSQQACRQLQIGVNVERALIVCMSFFIAASIAFEMK
jgi:hypothetical protein